MAKRHIKSRPGLFGVVRYYDENGKPIGKSRPGLFEGTNVYTDQNGQYIGKSRPGLLAEEVFLAKDRNKIVSHTGLCGDAHFQKGTLIGHTRPGLFGYKHTTLKTEDALSEEGFCEEEFL